MKVSVLLLFVLILLYLLISYKEVLTIIITYNAMYFFRFYSTDATSIEILSSHGLLALVISLVLLIGLSYFYLWVEQDYFWRIY
jgi:hypothetical protein